MKPHLIVMFDDRASAPSEADVTVAVNSTPMEIGPSTTTANGWETMDGITEGDVVSVSISDGSQAWDLEPVVVPPTPISMLPMDELLYSSIFLTLRDRSVVGPKSCPSVARPRGPGELNKRPS